MCKLKRKNKLISSLFIFILFLTNFIIPIPKIRAPPPPPFPNQFIGEILSNQTLTLNLLNSNVVITINSTHYPDKIGINFNANYTIFNPENNTNIKLVLPFSLGIEVIKSNFKVRLNKTQIDFDLYNFTEGTVNETEIYLDFISMFYIHNPITLIQSNLTILENETYTIGYKFSGLMKSPISSGGTLYIVYYLNTSKTWNGNTTGKVEFRVYGKIPGFATMGSGSYDRKVQIFDIIGGKSAIWEWNNRKMNMLAIGIVYDERSYSLFGIWDIIGIITVNVVFYIIIITVIIIIVRKRKRKRN